MLYIFERIFEWWIAQIMHDGYNYKKNTFHVPQIGANRLALSRMCLSLCFCF